MTPDMKKTRMIIDQAIRAHGGRVVEIHEADLDHDIVFNAADQRFRLAFKSRDGRKLLHLHQDREIDVYQLLHGFKGDWNDIEAMIQWLNQAPGLDDFDTFLLVTLQTYLQTLEGSADGF